MSPEFGRRKGELVKRRRTISRSRKTAAKR
jgi:hypothetical protein